MARKLRAFLSRGVLERTGSKIERRHGKPVCSCVNCYAEERAGAGGHGRESLGEQTIKRAHAGSECEMHDLSAFGFRRPAEFSASELFHHGIRDSFRGVF